MAFAGPFSNIVIFLIFGLFIRFFEPLLSVMPFLSVVVPALPLIQLIVIVNIVLAVFNLVPIPPLDGSKILFSFFPRSLVPLRSFLEKYQLLLALFFILFLWKFISPLIEVVYILVVGM